MFWPHSPWYYILFLVLMVFVVIFNFIKKRYTLVAIETDHFLFSRLFMQESPVYYEDIQEITFKELKKEKSELIIKLKGKTLIFSEFDMDMYLKLVHKAEKNNISFFLENINGFREKLRK